MQISDFHKNERDKSVATLRTIAEMDRVDKSASGATLREGDLAGRAYQQIRDAILSLEFQPGQPLQEVFLAQRLGTSRTPIREALRRLQAEGLVEQSTSRGVFVAQVSIEDVENAYRVLEVLEGLSSRLAAERLNEAAASELRALLRSLREAAHQGDLETWVKTDANLHETIRSIAGNGKLLQLSGLVYPTVERVRNIYLREGSEPEQLAMATQDHLAMGEAILARDAERAEALTRQLFAKAGKDNVRLLRHWVTPLRRSF